MPELPEVETTRRGIRPHVRGRRIESLVVRDARLRWPVPRGLASRIAGATVADVQRRAKYLLFPLTASNGTPIGTLLGHLGMSGSLRVVARDEPPRPHDHVDLVLARTDDDERTRGRDRPSVLRLRDPRRFGCLLFTQRDPASHALLKNLGPEPLSREFDGARLFELSRGRTAPVKCFVMDAAIVVGVGNIYASESLWRAAIHPRRPAGRVSRERYDALATAVKETLAAAIEKGGTTLRDFVSADGEPGHFRADLAVYDRAGASCPRCHAAIRVERVGQRSAFFCPRCQR